MESALVSGLDGLLLGVTHLGPGHIGMMLVGCALLYLGIKKGCEPLLLVPIGFGCILVNIPLCRADGSTAFCRHPLRHRESPTSSSRCSSSSASAR